MKVATHALRPEPTTSRLQLGKAQGPPGVLLRVPPEIFRCIFERLKHDKETLLSSSSVSRYWREVSLPWLFGRIEVASAQHFAGFLQFVDTHPSLGAHVKTLGFRPSGNPQLVSETSLRTLVSSALSGLSSLQSLSFCNIIIAYDIDPKALTPHLVDIEAKTQSNHHLRELSILCIRNQPRCWWTATLIWFLSRYTVDILKLIRVEIPLLDYLDDNVATSTPNNVRNSVQVRKLILDTSDTWYPDMYRLLEAVLQPGCVQAVSVVCGAYFEIPRILNFMEAVGQNVTYVSIDLGSFVPRSAIQEPNWGGLGESLACCPRLEHVRIRISGRRTRYYAHFPSRVVFTTIMPYAPRTLQTLIVELVDDVRGHDYVGQCEIWDLHALSDYLTHEPAVFPSFTSVGIELRLRDSDNNEQLAGILLEQMSALKDAGLMCVFCDDITPAFRTFCGIEPLPAREE